MNPMIDFAAWLQALGMAGVVIVLVVKATLILVIARLLLLAFPRASAASRHLGVTVALCSILLLPFAAFVAPGWQWAVLAPVQPQEMAANDGIGSTGSDQEHGTFSTAVTVMRATGVVRQERLTAISQFIRSIKESWKGLLLLAVAAVSGLLLLRMFAGIIGVGLVARRSDAVSDPEALEELKAAREHLGLKRNVRLLRSDRVSVPVVWGLLQPVLMLPASSVSWTRERLRVVLLHELAHVKRGDGITLLLTRAAVAVFWFHPMMWMLERDGRRECERACDDLVLATGTRPSDYAEHLLSIARGLPHFDPFRSVTLAMSRRSQLEGRLLSILEPGARRNSFSSRAALVAGALALFVIVPLAGIRLVAAPPPGQEETKAIPEGSVDFGPNFAARIAAAPQIILAKLDRMRRSDDAPPVTAEDWYDRGMSMHRKDRYPEAIAAFQESIRRGYKAGASMYNIACGYALSDDAPSSIAWLQRAVNSGYDVDGALEDSDFDPIRSNSDFQQLLARATDSNGRDERLIEARDRYAALRAENSKDGEEWFDAGLDLLRLRMTEEAIDSYLHAIKLGQKTSTAMYNLACAYSLKGDVDSGILWLQRSIENGFDSVHKLDSDPDIARLRTDSRFPKIKQLANDFALTSGKRAFSWDGERPWRESLASYRELTVKYPTQGRAWFNLGYAQLQSGDNRGSADSFRRSRDLGYRAATSAYNLACAYARDGQIDASFAALHDARAKGFDLSGYLDDDNDLEPLRDDPRFEQLRSEVGSEKHKKKKHEGHWVFPSAASSLGGFQTSARSS
ncbi:MAG: hypothetical protein JJE51_09155 [Thermoanaerobaculia bacterium]|nr:hypothetical protein [Thermoanaerobaculia bacterium]